MNGDQRRGQGSLFGRPTVYDDPAEVADSALRAVKSVAQRLEEFTTDEVAEQLTDWMIEEPRQLGPAMQRAMRAGWIAPTDRTRATRNPAAHFRPKAIWRSLLVTRNAGTR